ncbi:hypothetical protein [Oryzihumus leptocrescens]|uniref:Uncharacterized protein n=1 Tax=Oryzihumus leptocrescens TaxID=297536 RepID=A0A542ZEI7_9MICO|nr:hypothetical protein [Oryzihumus leptocrescens]TQL58762.1 hypothetical protein FB474_0099 [Oryzihumus leptocrescens]
MAKWIIPTPASKQVRVGDLRTDDWISDAPEGSPWHRILHRDNAAEPATLVIGDTWETQQIVEVTDVDGWVWRLVDRDHPARGVQASFGGADEFGNEQADGPADGSPR